MPAASILDTFHYRMQLTCPHMQHACAFAHMLCLLQSAVQSGTGIQENSQALNTHPRSKQLCPNRSRLC